MKRKILCLVTLIAFLFLFNSQVKLQADQNTEGAPTNQIKLLSDAKAGILIEMNTGKVLYEQNAHEKRSPASMTKIMSILLVTEAIEAGKLKWEDIITVSAHASSYGGSQVYLAENEQMSVEDLYKAMVIASGNDATVALAETVAGSEEMFVQMMNDKVKEIGLENTVFMDPTGLTDYGDGHYSTAYDMAMLSRHLLVNHGETVLKYSSIYEDYLRKGTEREFWLVNTNKLVRHYEGVDGLKTGWTSESGYNLTATMFKDDMRLISTVMGNTTPAKRSNETVKLLNYGYSLYEVQEYRPADYVVGEYESIYMSPRRVNVITKEPIYFVVKKGEKLEGFRDEFHFDFTEDEYQVGDVIGHYKIIKNGKVVDEVELTVSEDVKRVNFFELFFRTLEKTLFG
jgi:serine-type D-Ala-D-Ala carboxypeptidase (penicillin-binding protein 5/6)